MRNFFGTILQNVFLMQAVGGATERLFRGSVSAHTGGFDMREIAAAKRRNRRQNHR
jgi:hypothetical protein